MKLTGILLTLAAIACAAWMTSCASQAPAERASGPSGDPVKTETSAADPNAQDAARSSASVVHAAPGTATAATAEGSKGDAEKGKAVFEQCAICHNVDSDEEKMGPALKGLFKKEKLKNGHAVNEENVRAVVKAGGNGMPGYEDLLSAEEMDNLIAYLKTV